MSDQGVEYEQREGVAYVTLNRPQARNALSSVVIARLGRIAVDLHADESVRAVLISGAGEAFCAGGDVKEMMSLAEDGDRTPQARAHDAAGALHVAISALLRLPKPVLCAVGGVVAGAGVGLALTGDIVWAAERATFTLGYTAIGLSPDGGSTLLLPRMVGPKLAAELMMTNRLVDAEEAREIGLISRVVPDDELLPEMIDLANYLANGPTRAYAEVKSLLRRSVLSGIEAQLEEESMGIMRSMGTADFAEGVSAFVHKRKPEFTGR